MTSIRETPPAPSEQQPSGSIQQKSHTPDHDYTVKGGGKAAEKTSFVFDFVRTTNTAKEIMNASRKKIVMEFTPRPSRMVVPIPPRKLPAASRM